jgi:4-hydroxybenzoate polyprenyltransferase
VTYGSRPVTPRDALALVKPNIAFMALLTAAGGMSLAPGAFVLSHAVVLLIGTALIVGAANTLNMYLERDVDRHDGAHQGPPAAGRAAWRPSSRWRSASPRRRSSCRSCRSGWARRR